MKSTLPKPLFSIPTGPPSPAAPVAPKGFALPASRFHETQRRLALAKRGRPAKHLIRPENCQEVIARLPAPGETTHAVLMGNFVVGDLVAQIIRERGPASHVRLATLSLSEKNADALAELLEAGQIGELSLLVSDYFAQVSKDSVAPYCRARLSAARWGVSRVHCKVFVLPCGADNYILHGSANLRSSANAENLAIENCPDLAAFHAAWIDELVKAAREL